MSWPAQLPVCLPHARKPEEHGQLLKKMKLTKADRTFKKFVAGFLERPSNGNAPAGIF
jgi:hypothetical protein